MHTHTLSHTHTHTNTLSLSLSHTHTLSIPLCLSLSLASTAQWLESTLLYLSLLCPCLFLSCLSCLCFFGVCVSLTFSPRLSLYLPDCQSIPQPVCQSLLIVFCLSFCCVCVFVSQFFLCVSLYFFISSQHGTYIRWQLRTWFAYMEYIRYFDLQKAFGCSERDVKSEKEKTYFT